MILVLQTLVYEFDFKVVFFFNFYMQKNESKELNIHILDVVIAKEKY